MLEFTSTPTKQNVRMVEEKEFNNDLAIALVDSAGSVIDTSCDTLKKQTKTHAKKNKF